MRCPMCNARVRDQDALQIHFLESCDAIGKEEVPTDKFDEKNSMENESSSDLVEIVFIWEDTKDTIEKTICLISSLAGQINLKRNPSKDEFQSAKVIVPCGIHSCQLVAEEECYPVIDIEIDDSSQFAHIILQEDVESKNDARSSNAAYRNKAPSDLAHSDQRYQKSKSSMVEGAMQQDEIDAEYARKIMDELKRDENGTDTDELASLRSHDSNCETARMKRRKKQLKDLSTGQSKDSLSKLAKNGVHQVQVHSPIDTMMAGKEADLIESKTDLSKDAKRKDSHGSILSGRNEGRKDSKGSMNGSTYGSRRDSRGSLSERWVDGNVEHYIEPPNGFQSGNEQKQRIETKRSKHLTKIAKSKGYDSLSDQNALADNGRDSLRRKVREPMEADVPSEEKPSWGFHDQKLAMEVAKVESSVTTASEEIISELIAKCDTYKEEADKFGQENLRLKNEFGMLQQKSRDDEDSLLAKDEKIEDYQAKCESYETELKRVKEENDELMGKTFNMNIENEDLTAKVDYQEEQINKKNEELETLEKRLESILRDNKDLKDENESLKMATKLQQEDMDRIIQDEVEDLKNKLDSVKGKSRSFEYEEMKKISGLERKVNRLKAENDRLRQQLSRIKVEANTFEHDKDGIDSVDYNNHQAIDKISNELKSNSYVSRDLSPTENTYSRLAKHENIYRPSNREAIVSSDATHKSYDDYNTRHSMLYTSSRARPPTNYDTNQNYLRDSETLRLKTSQSRRYDVVNSKTSPTGPIRAPHFDYITEHSSALSKYGQIGGETSRDHVITRERKSRRERPRSFHGVSASESDSRELRRNLAAFQHEDPSTYTYTLRRDFDDSLDHDYLKRPTKPFAPLSMDDILVGMRVLVTRSSGRIGKGVVKWKGYLDGHAEPFIGIELETPNGKHDGMFEDRRLFSCKRDHGIFSKFSKVVMVWGSL